jgi:hypothetical protein
LACVRTLLLGITQLQRHSVLEIKRPEREDNCSPSSNVEVVEWSFAYTPPIHLNGVMFRHGDLLPISKLHLEEMRMYIESYFNGDGSTG